MLNLFDAAEFKDPKVKEGFKRYIQDLEAKDQADRQHYKRTLFLLRAGQWNPQDL